jgi:hypothetical protein
MAIYRKPTHIHLVSWMAEQNAPIKYTFPLSHVTEPTNYTRLSKKIFR